MEMWIKACLVAAALLSAAGAKFFLKLADDNAIEEIAEEVIEIETGFDIDLTPESLEKK